MKETGLLFTPENYDKVARGEKTQTRRILKWQPDSSGAILGPREMEEQPGVWLYNGQRFTCPYGTAGDRLYAQHAAVRQRRCCIELTDVRVERVQEITETDAISEGCLDAYGPDFHVGAFRKLWQSINGKGSWKRNDWVWVLSYRKVQP